jgi:M6 family metalloprotease-like protein
MSKKISILVSLVALLLPTLSFGAAPPCESTTNLNAIVIAVDFPDAQYSGVTIDAINDMHFANTNSVKAYLEETSYGKLILTGESYGWYTLDDLTVAEAANDIDLLAATALEKVAGEHPDPEFDLTAFNRIFLISPVIIGGVGNAGSCANIKTRHGTMTAALTHIRSSSLQDIIKTTAISAHEAMHTFGVSEANSLDYESASIAPVGQGMSYGTMIPYGDVFDTMGSELLVHTNAHYKNHFGWLNETNVVTLNSSGTYDIEPLSSGLGNKTKALKIYRGMDLTNFYKEYLWVEFRQPIGYDANLDPGAYDGGLVHHEIWHAWADSGAASSYLLDMTPGSDPSCSLNDERCDYYDSALSVGGAFTDPYTGTDISVPKITGNGNLRVIVSFDPAKVDTDEDGITDLKEATYGTDMNLEDTDGDGMLDIQEVCHDGDCNIYNPHPAGSDTDATSSDTDGDGIPDGWENDHAVADPLVDDSDADSDTDGLSNLQEYQSNTDPSNADTDQDNIPDGIEVTYGLDPNQRDSQGDSDNDGVINYLEYARGTDINDISSFPVFQTIYVDDDNTSGVEDGTLANPYNTIQEGIDAALAGDRVAVASGTYSPFTLNTPISLEGPDDVSAVVTGLNTDTLAHIEDVHWGVISGFTFEAGSTGVYILSSSDLTMQNDLIINNLIGMIVDNSSFILVVNNTIINNMFEGFFHYLSSDWTIKNSIIWGNGNDIDMSFGNWENVSFSDLQNAEGMPVFSFLGQISSDPIFSDPANNDFSLTPCSPCLGTGENGYDMGIEINSGVPSCAEYCPLDSDGDGYTVCGADFIRGTGTDEDCDDNDPNVYPGASLICDGKDNNCDGYKDFLTDEDKDGDGVVWCAGDCDDNDPDRSPNIEEGPYLDATCSDSIDNDCDNRTDASDVDCMNPCIDNDGDGYGVNGDPNCPNGPGVDCNDNIFNVYPGAPDSVCNGIDNNCDGTADEGYVPTATSCGVGVCTGNTGQLECQSGSVVDTCDPIAGAAADDTSCDGLDNDCNGTADEDYIAAQCGTGVCQSSSSCENGVETACTPASPTETTEVTCDGLDNDCDGEVDENLDTDHDGDGFASCDGDCNDNDITMYPGAPLLCDGKDNNCDTYQDFMTDEDKDGDGVVWCAGDCDDNDPNKSPLLTEGPYWDATCSDTIDNDCDNRTDASDVDCFPQDCSSYIDKGSCNEDPNCRWQGSSANGQCNPA